MSYVMGVALVAIMLVCVGLARGSVGTGIAWAVAVVPSEALRVLARSSGGVTPGPWALAWGYGSPRWLSLLLVAVYMSYAAFPLLVAAFERRASVVVPAAIVLTLGALINALVPVRPPWMAGVSTRAMDAFAPTAAFVADDASPVAAFPSLHVAFPAVVALTGRRRWWWLYALLQSFAVVVGGEHWVLDVVGGWLLAFVVAFLYRRIDERRRLLRTIRIGQDVRDGDGGLQRAVP